jgi:hypothetical protein
MRMEGDEGEIKRIGEVEIGACIHAAAISPQVYEAVSLTMPVSCPVEYI